MRAGDRGQANSDRCLGAFGMRKANVFVEARMHRAGRVRIEARLPEAKRTYLSTSLGARARAASREDRAGRSIRDVHEVATPSMYWQTVSNRDAPVERRRSHLDSTAPSLASRMRTASRCLHRDAQNAAPGQPARASRTARIPLTLSARTRPSGVGRCSMNAARAANRPMPRAPSSSQGCRSRSEHRRRA